MTFAAGWNMPGYMPDPEHVAIFDTPAEAAAYLADEVDRWWDQDYDTDEPRTVVDARYLVAHTLLHNAPTAPFTVTVGGYVMWIEPSTEPVEEQ